MMKNTDGAFTTQDGVPKLRESRAGGSSALLDSWSLDSSSLFSSPRSHVKLSKHKAFPRKEVLPVCLRAELPVTRCDSLDSWLLS